MPVMPPLDHYALRHDYHEVIMVFQYLRCFCARQATTRHVSLSVLASSWGSFDGLRLPSCPVGPPTWWNPRCPLGGIPSYKMNEGTCRYIVSDKVRRVRRSSVGDSLASSALHPQHMGGMFFPQIYVICVNYCCFVTHICKPPLEKKYLPKFL
jgi:hypothetical protein